MALVNVGVLMALWGHRVLLVDWDIEAPGLEVFLKKNVKLIGDAGEIPGIVDLLEARSTSSRLDWRNCLLRAEFLGSQLDIISAGRKTPDYRTRVQRLDWDTLFREHRVGNYVNAMRDEWRNAYDFVLVDSRTGITDIGDICTVLLPDALVLMFITNHQNIDGICSVMARATAARKKLPVDRSKLLGLPIPGRDEVYNEHDKSIEWKNIFAERLGYLYKDWLPREIEPVDALNKLFIPYVTNWSFGECIPVLESQRELQDPTTIGSAYARLSALLVNRLDWYELERNTTVEEVKGARVELKRTREEANRALEAERAAKQEVEARLSLHKRKRWTIMSTLVLILAFFSLTVTSLYYYRMKTFSDTQVTKELLNKIQMEYEAAAVRLMDERSRSDDLVRQLEAQNQKLIEIQSLSQKQLIELQSEIEGLRRRLGVETQKRDLPSRTPNSIVPPRNTGKP